MQDSKPNLSDIAIPETVEVAIMQWWNSTACGQWRMHGPAEAAEHLGHATEAVKVALLSLARNPVIDDELIHKLRNQWDSAISGAGLGAYNPFMIRGYLSEVFLRKPEPVPEEVKALLWEVGGAEDEDALRHNEDILAAFNAGKEARDADKH